MVTARVTVQTGDPEIRDNLPQIQNPQEVDTLSEIQVYTQRLQSLSLNVEARQKLSSLNEAIRQNNTLRTLSNYYELIDNLNTPLKITLYQGLICAVHQSGHHFKIVNRQIYISDGSQEIGPINVNNAFKDAIIANSRHLDSYVQHERTNPHSNWQNGATADTYYGRSYQNTGPMSTYSSRTSNWYDYYLNNSQNTDPNDRLFVYAYNSGILGSHLILNAYNQNRINQRAYRSAARTIARNPNAYNYTHQREGICYENGSYVACGRGYQLDSPADVARRPRLGQQPQSDSQGGNSGEIPQDSDGQQNGQDQEKKDPEIFSFKKAIDEGPVSMMNRVMGQTGGLTALAMLGGLIYLAVKEKTRPYFWGTIIGWGVFKGTGALNYLLGEWDKHVKLKKEIEEWGKENFLGELEVVRDCYPDNLFSNFVGNLMLLRRERKLDITQVYTIDQLKEKAKNDKTGKVGYILDKLEDTCKKKNVVFKDELPEGELGLDETTDPKELHIKGLNLKEVIVRLAKVQKT